MGIGCLFRDRFFHEHMFPTLKEELGDLEMGGRRSGDGGCINEVGKLLKRAGGFCPEPGRHFLGRCAIRVVNRRELALSEFP